MRVRFVGNDNLLRFGGLAFCWLAAAAAAVAAVISKEFRLVIFFCVLHHFQT
jgi:hypothetical protein